MIVAPFFQKDNEAALMQQVEWLQKHVQLSDQFFLHLLKVDERTFFCWRIGDEILSEASQEHLREFWQMTLHLLSFVNFDLGRLKRIVEHSIDTKAGSVGSPYNPPWVGASLRSYLETNG